jgi:hypothetical protein
MDPASLSGRVMASFTFAEGVSELVVANNSDLTGKTLKIFGARTMDLRIEAIQPVRVQGGAPFDLEVAAENLRIRHLAATPGAPGKNAAFTLAATGRVRSLKQDGQEMLPTQLAELMNKPPTEKGLWGLSAAFLVFTAGLFLKRALDQLVAAALPDNKTT